MADGGAWAGDQKNAESEWSEDGFEYITTAKGDDEKWMAPGDSGRRLGLNIRSRWILIVVGSTSWGG